MANVDVNSSKSGPVTGHASWACKSQDRQLADILFPVPSDSSTDLNQVDRDTPNRWVPVLLEQDEETSPCVITLRCASHSPALITSLLVISEARTIEVYSLAGDYCGTCRGEMDADLQPESADRGPFYRKHLVLECPSTSCEVKLLSLGGRESVAMARVVLGLQALQPADCSPSLGPSIDMLRVQTMMEEMGTTLSPGAQSLMGMVQFQQKNQSDVLGGFLPLLMGSGALSALARGTNGPSAPAGPTRPQPPVNTQPTDGSPPADDIQPAEGSDSGSPANHAKLAEMMSPFLHGRQGQGQGRRVGPDLLPMLQSVCGQVTQLRIEDAAEERKKLLNRPREEHACCHALEQAMEKRLDQMEKRLKEHIDQRLDTVQQNLERALLQVLPLVSLSQAVKNSAATSDQKHTAQPQPQSLH